MAIEEEDLTFEDVIKSNEDSPEEPTIAQLERDQDENVREMIYEQIYNKAA